MKLHFKLRTFAVPNRIWWKLW